MTQLGLFDETGFQEKVPGPDIQLLALSLWRPWDQAIIHGGKRHKNRTWSRPSLLGQRIAIHAGLKYDREGAEKMKKAGLFSPPADDASPTGIVGLARVSRFVTSSDSPWFFGPIGWVLSEVVALPAPVPCRGAQGVWRVPADIALQVLSQISAPTIHVTNRSSTTLHGPGRLWSIMIRPRPQYGELGDGFVSDLRPTEGDFARLRTGQITVAEYKDRTVAMWTANGTDHLVPGKLRAMTRIEGSSVAVQSGDTLFCSCSRELADRGKCHRSWAAELLSKVGWKVIRDGVVMSARK